MEWSERQRVNLGVENVGFSARAIRSLREYSRLMIGFKLSFIGSRSAKDQRHQNGSGFPAKHILAVGAE